MTFITRFAPSPTGLLHLGHAYSAQVGYNLSREAGGHFMLRIEDIDVPRCKPEFERAIIEDLAWLGIDYATPVRRQSAHLAEYGAVIGRLQDMGVIYRCFLTRAQVAEAVARAPQEGDTPPVYRGPETPFAADENAERTERGDAFAWRLSLGRCREVLGPVFDDLAFTETGPARKGLQSARPDALGDVVLARKDLGTSYHVAVTHDDALQGISHVVRGMDLFDQTPVHVLLQALMGWPTPVYHHHALVRDDRGKRLAKRDDARSIRAYREEGLSPADVLRLAERMTGKKRP